MKIINKLLTPKKPYEKTNSMVKENTSEYLVYGRFGTYLVSKGVIDEYQLSNAIEEQKNSQERLGEILVKHNVLSDDELLDLLSDFLGVARVNLTEIEIDPSTISLLSEEFARENCLIPISLNKGLIQVAMADPTNFKAIEDIRILTGFDVETMLAAKEDIESIIRKHLTVEKTIAELELEQKEMSPSNFEVYRGGNEEGRDAPTIRLVDSLIKEAILMGASDIHWEPRENSLEVRYRIDGKLETKQSFPIHMAQNLIARIKVMANLDVAERRLPQDGRATFVGNEANIDLRISTLPTVYGEKLVVRILDPGNVRRTLDFLGMSSNVESRVRSLIKGKPHGILLVVGPTGSGKTTTLYALLRELASEEYNIVSIEDPVEYRLPGVVSVQVNAKTGLTFARGLRSILRQDPDIIMIGEIRDKETAEIAIAAALTGHFVLSTLHTNSAAETLTRLMDMGIEPYLLAAVLRGVLSQRLVRRLCNHCKEPRELSDLEQTSIGLPKEITKIYKARGCPQCRFTGYSGRVGLHELLVFDEEIKELVLTRQSPQAIEKKAISAGMVPLYLDGFFKAEQGLTSLEEVLFYASSMFF